MRLIAAETNKIHKHNGGKIFLWKLYGKKLLIELVKRFD